jgi:DNA polymerase elongation subunit (family B)
MLFEGLVNMSMKISYNDEFTVEYIGEIEENVYDIEVEDNHNFFGNDILVHNSMYINMAPLIERTFGTIDITRKQGEEFLDKVCREKLEPIISNGYEKLAETMGAYRNAMSMKREKITDKTIFLAKKRYIMNVLNSEGVHYENPKISVTGVESVRSSTPEICRNKLKEAFNIVMTKTEDDVQAFILEFKKLFFTLPAEEVAKISGTDDLEKYMSGDSYTKGCPMHVRGCIVYNNHIKKLGLDKKFNPIQSGDKIKFIYMKTPNPIRENIISFPDVLPKEMGLSSFIDYETQFDKVFLSPLQTILDALGWSSEKVDTLEGFFS